MANPTTRDIVQALIKSSPNATAAEIAKKAKAKGVTASADWVMEVVYRLRGEAKKQSAPVKAVAPVAAVRPPRPRPAPAPTAAPPAAVADVTGVLANVALVHRVVLACGGVEPARQVAEAVRACGGVDGFLQHLDLVAGMQPVA
ncbi:MAG TPA: hypothetical protein VM597_08135 [Gemmataceae bacterium]|nr:hypothetical protein [Gemmataceae bacterium]